MQKMISKKKDVYSSLFLAILLINISSILVVSIFNYFVFHRKSEAAYLDSFVRYNQSVTDLAFENMDKQILESALRISQLYFSPVRENAPLFLLQEKEGAISSEDVRAFTTQMNRIERSYPHVRSIDIYFEATGTVVTGFDNIHYPYRDERVDRYLPWLESWQENGSSRQFMVSPEVYTVKEPVITYVERITQPKWEGKGMILAIHLSPSAFGSYIDEGEGALTVMTREGTVLYDTMTKDDQMPSADEVLKQMEQSGFVLQKNGPPFSMELDGERITAFHSVSSGSNMIYLYRISNSRFYTEYDATRRVFILSFVISIGFNMLMLLVVSYYNHVVYRKRVRKISAETGITMGEEKQGFDDSLRHLTKEITSLHDVVNSSKGLIFQSAVRSLILQKNQEQSYHEVQGYVTGEEVCTFFFYLSELDVRQLSVERLQEDYTPGSRPWNVLFTTMEKDGLVALLLSQAKRGQEDGIAFIKEMDARFENYSMVSGSILALEKDGIRSSYKSTVEAARYRFILPEQRQINYDSLHIETRKGSGSHLKLFEMMEKNMRSENLLDFKSRMEGLVISFKSGSYTMDYCNSTLRDLVTLFYRVMQQNQLDMQVVFGYDIREHYKQITDIDEFHQWADYLCETILRNIRQKKSTVDPGIRQKIEELIEANLDGSISLDLIADELHMRPDVISRMFRQVMGKGYTEYIRERKLSRAIELMEEDYSIKEIAEQLGYSSAQYFIKVFKESYGITPFQYKKNQEKERQTHGKQE